MRRMLILALLAIVPLAAQDKKPEPDATVQKLFILKYADPRTVAELLRVFNPNVVPNTEMHALAITAAERSMPAIEEAISRLDVPGAAPKNIDLTCYLIIGSDSESGLGGALPKDLDSVVTQLKNAFPFKSYRLMDVLNTRTRTGRLVDMNSLSGSLSGSSEPVNTNLRINSVSMAGDNTTIRIDSLRANIRVPVPKENGFSVQNLGVNTDVDMKEGQKVVIGRMGITRDQALFLVLLAKVVN